MEIKPQFAKVRILVIGDVMLDQYWWGTVDRISPEAPVPVVSLRRTTEVPGGAANVATNITGLGAMPILVGCIGDDPDGHLLAGRLESAGIDASHLIRTSGRSTAVKTRVVAHSQHMVRVDRENVSELSSSDTERIIEKIENLIPHSDLVILSDYAKGVLSPAVLKQTIRSAVERKVPVLVDPKGKNYSKYLGASILTPNRREAVEACSLDDTADAVSVAGAKLLNDLALTAVVVTEGEQGMTLFERDRPPIRFAAEAHEIFDVTGAGDTVIAALGVAIAAGMTLVDSVRIANTAASLVVEQVGTTSASIDTLIEKLEENPSRELEASP